MSMFLFRTGKGSVKLRLKERPQEEKQEIVKTGYFASPVDVKSAFSFPGVQPSAGGVGAQAPEQKDDFEESKEISATGVILPDYVSQLEKDIVEKQFSFMKEEKIEDLKAINVKYPLIPREPKQGERVFAYAHIFWDPAVNDLVYNVIEPRLTENEQVLLAEIKDYIEEKIDIDFGAIKKQEAADYVLRLFDKALDYFVVRHEIKEVIKYYIFRDFIGLGIIEPFIKDRFIEDISCDGVNIPLYVYHRDPKIGSLRTNKAFMSNSELDSFVNKLAERTGGIISIAKPLLDGTLPDGSRVQCTLGSDIARQGSNFTIRMFTEKPLTPTDIISFNTMNIRMMAYLWFLVEHGASVLVSGGTATGKTSLLNVLSLFIKPTMKIVSIEDTAELRLPHPHWIPEVARTAISEKGAVDMFELLRESLRQRPDYIIVGEVRGREAYVLFQQMAVGHPGLSTIHAENMPKLVDRLTTQPISLAPSLLQNLDIVIFLKRIKRGTRYVRKVSNVFEVVGFNKSSGYPKVNHIFKWNSKDDSFESVGKSMLLRKVAELTAMTDSEIGDSVEKRSRVLEWMLEQNIRDYIKVGKVLSLFYSSQDALLERIGIAGEQQ